MKVITVITQMEGGGAQNASIRMAQELRKRGHQAETCFLYVKRGVYSGYDHVKVMSPTAPRGPLDYLRIFASFVGYVRSERPDAIIGFTYYANIFGAVAGLLAGVKLRVASQRNPSWTYPRAGRVLDRIVGSLGGYTGNIAVSRAVLDSFAAYPASYLKKMTVVHNGIPHREATLPRIEARKRYGLPLHDKLLVTTGRLSFQKNHEVLLRAIAGLPEVHLAIAGGGELEEELRRLRDALGMQERVSFVGELHPEEIPEFLSAGDLFVFPSRFEAFGFSVMEAALAGMPLLVSDIPALREILDRWEDGGGAAAIFLPAEEDGSWSEAVALLLEDQALRRSYCDAARERSRRFTLERMVDGYEALLRH